LEQLALNGKNHLARFHALWTLEGLDALDPIVLFSLLDDENSLISTTAVRLLEPMALDDKNIRLKLGQSLMVVLKGAPIEQVLQISLTANALDPIDSHPLLTRIVEQYDTSALVRDAVMSSLHNEEFDFMKRLWTTAAWQSQTPSNEIFMEMLTASIVKKRSADELTELLAMLPSDKKSFGWKEKAVLTAISIQGKNKAKPVRLASVPKVLSANNIDDDQLRTLLSMFEWPGHVADTSTVHRKNPLNESEQKQFVSGRQLYLTTCAGCHGSDGGGQPRFAPPLKASDWVLGDEKRLALILLHGMEGPLEVNGKRYDAPEILPVMPSHSTIDDAALASVLTYIRNEWGNAGGAVSRRTVGMTRVMSQGRVMPWTADELNKYVKETKIPEDN
jgi:mono/diheme cytochrome c family protein